MRDKSSFIWRSGAVFILTIAFAGAVFSQGRQTPEVLDSTAAANIVPTSFYFAGQSAPTQTRNSAVARFAKNRLVIAALVDTSGYSTEISGKYEGFFITDSPIIVSGRRLATGAYGFGFARGALRIFDVSGRQILSVPTATDARLRRPQPLAMVAAPGEVRFYKGRSYAIISAR